MAHGPLAELLARQAVRAAAGGDIDVARAALDELLLRFDRATLARAESIGPARTSGKRHLLWIHPRRSDAIAVPTEELVIDAVAHAILDEAER